MKESIETQIGSRYYLIRNLLLLTRKEVLDITGISISTLTRIEKGQLSSNTKVTDKLSNLYQVTKEDIYNVSKPIPSWKDLRRKTLSAHKNNEKLLKYLNKKPESKQMIEYRVMRSPFLNNFRTAKEVAEHIRKRYTFSYSHSTIKNSLDILTDLGLLEVNKSENESQKFKKASALPKNLEQQIETIQQKLEEKFRAKSADLVTPAFDKMARMIVLLNEGPKRRSELTRFSDYENATNNIKRSLKILEELGLVERTIREKPTSSRQRYRLTQAGKEVASFK